MELVDSDSSSSDEARAAQVVLDGSLLGEEELQDLDGTVVEPTEPASEPVAKHGSLEPRMVHEGLAVRNPETGEAVAFIKYKPQVSDLFVKCPCPSHGKQCTKTKTCHESCKALSQGRPLGMLAAWILSRNTFDTKAEHVYDCKPSRKQRLQARAQLRKEPNYQMFADYERPRREGEEEEPL